MAAVSVKRSVILAFTNQTGDLGNARVGQLVDEVTNE